MPAHKQYTEYKSQDYPKVCNQILSFWKTEQIFEKSIALRSSSPTFTFYEGPPSANGTPGIHHVMARAVKDIFCRYKTMKGFKVERKGGWDTHGLPVELQVEKELGITKEEIGTKISVEDYNQKCKEAVMKYKDQWDQLTEIMGFWLDLDHPYITFETPYIESLWYLLKRLYDKGLLYKGYTIQPYSPAAGTGLSSHELNQPGTYKNVKDTTIVAQFKLVNNSQSARWFSITDTDIFMLAWTTTPWTLPANNSLAVGKKIKYVLIRTFNPYTFLPISVIMAKERMQAFFTDKAKNIELDTYKAGDSIIPYTILAEMEGNELVGMDYEQLMPYIKLPKPAFSVLSADFVSTDDGTGIVHIAKTFGADDFKTSVQNQVPGVMVKDDTGKEWPIVDKQGRYVKEITDFAGLYVKNEYYAEHAPDKSLDVLIAIKLKEENKAFRVEKYEHTYPHCWRTDKPILYYPLDSWFIKTTAYKDQLVALNKSIQWKPESTGTGRFGNWLENLVDWNLSRSRYWGTPLPIWVTEDRKEEICIGSIEELKNEVEKSVKAGFMSAIPENYTDLHKPFVDNIILVSKSGKKMFREPDLVDVWFDSGAMPYAQWHYPFENENQFKSNFPADFIAEGVDQTRGWFFTLHAISVMLFDQVSFKNVIANGLVLDKNGNKMSKRLGNAIDPFHTLQTYGADATRWYMISNANPWDNLRFDMNGVVEVQRKFLGTLFNTYSFFALYANIDGYKFNHLDPAIALTESDRWILSRLQVIINLVNESFEQYEPTKAARFIQDFVQDDLSNWYVRLNRKRYWVGEYTEDKKAAYEVLYRCLVEVSKLAAPIAPFYMDQLYKDLTGNLSVHLSDFPKADPSIINISLMMQTELAQRVSSMVHALRKKERIKVRQPLSRILIAVSQPDVKDGIENVREMILNEVNVRNIEWIDDTKAVLKKKIKPNFPKLGKQFGNKMKIVAEAVQKLSPQEIIQFEKEEKYTFNIENQWITLNKEDVDIVSEDIEGWTVASENGITVALDIHITDELRFEGLARDIINRIQNLRKDIGLEVQDKIVIKIEKHMESWVNQALKTHEQYICKETQGIQYEIADNLTEFVDLEIDELILKVNIKSIQ